VSLTLRKQKLRTPENRVFKKICGYKKSGLNEQFRILNSEELNVL
jgi:hypothetical protein